VIDSGDKWTTGCLLRSSERRISLVFQSPRLVAAIAEFVSLGGFRVCPAMAA